MKAEERAERLCKQRGIYMGHENAIAAAIRAHASECYERAALEAEEQGETLLAATIRALKE